MRGRGYGVYILGSSLRAIVTSKRLERHPIESECIIQLTSNGRTGILSMVNTWKFAQGQAQFAFFVLGNKMGHQLALRSFFFLPGLVHR
jgi:hypothetical protein